MGRLSAAAVAVVAALGATLSACGGGDATAQRSAPGSRPAWMTLDVKVRQQGAGRWHDSVPVTPGDVVEVKAAFANRGDRQAKAVRADLDTTPGLELVGGSQRLQELTLPVANAKPLPGNVAKGVALGPFAPKGAAQLRFALRVHRRAEQRTLSARVRIAGKGFANSDAAKLFVRAP